ncbi:MAG: hypothetical protein JW850_09065 [Thermoflexales bacterium]|nr:hypothetical protein [Thermoflexales bacterium]
MTQDPVPLTPAEQMRHIREAVNAADRVSAKEAQAVLSSHFSRLDSLRAHVAELESKMLIKEMPFVSHAPLVGRLIVAVRNAWNWMSTKWYALPLLTQQNSYNMAVTQALRETITALESMAHSVQETHMRLAELEARLAETGADQESTGETIL